MADYTAKTIHESGMETECVVISLKYDLIDYIEKAVSGAHDQNKQMLVWTPNEKESQKHFLCSGADGLITDKVVQAVEIQNELKERSDLQRIVDRIMTIVS